MRLVLFGSAVRFKLLLSLLLNLLWCWQAPLTLFLLFSSMAIYLAWSVSTANMLSINWSAGGGGGDSAWFTRVSSAVVMLGQAVLMRCVFLFQRDLLVKAEVMLGWAVVLGLGFQLQRGLGGGGSTWAGGCAGTWVSIAAGFAGVGSGGSAWAGGCAGT